jgi:hypothetical protein
MAQGKWIPVLPKNYRCIALHAISVANQPVVLMDHKPIVDFSEQGPLTQCGIRTCRDFEIRNGAEPILGFHDHPNEMWVTVPYAFVAEHCARQGWLKMERHAF